MDTAQQVNLRLLHSLMHLVNPAGKCLIIPCHMCSLFYYHLYLLWASTLDKSLSPA